MCEQVEFLYVSELDLEPELLAKQGAAEPTALDALVAAETTLRGVEPYTDAAIEAAFDADRERRGWKPRPFFMPIRVAISGKTQTPPLFPMLAALGRERVAAADYARRSTCSARKRPTAE